MTDSQSDRAARQARREWRRKRRRRGKRLILASYGVVAVALIVGAVGLLGNDGDGDETSTDGGSLDDGRASRDRRGSSTTGTDNTVVIDLLPSTTLAGGTGGAGGSGRGVVGADDIVTGESFGIRTVFGIVQVRAAPRGDRPRPNLAPTISAPNNVERDVNGDAIISGIVIDDEDYPGSGDIGVLLIVNGGTITVRLNPEVQLLAPNSSAFVALSGPPEALTRALADLRVHTDSATEVFISVTDWGYGDLPRAEAASTSVVVG